MVTKNSIGAKNIQMPDSIVPLPVGSRLHEYEILGVVGEGGFGVVYHGVDKRLEREVAIKEFMPSMWASRLEDGSVVCRSDKHKLIFETALAGFVNEARLLARFKHRALVQVLHFWEQNGTAYMVMPLYKGQTLKQMVKQNDEPITQARLFAIIKSLMGALEVLHLENCYHRDLSPDNVIILADGSPILLDFGAARRTIDDVDQTFTVILKPGYAPVEQYANDSSIQQGPWTDIYGLAALCYFVITKKTPVTSVTRLMRDQLIPLVEQNLTGFDTHFLKSIDWGMAVKPEDRPQSIAEYRDHLISKEKVSPPIAKVTEKIEVKTLEVEKPEIEKLEVKKTEVKKIEVKKIEVKKIEVKKVEDRKPENLASRAVKNKGKSLFKTEFSELASSSKAALPVVPVVPVGSSKNTPSDTVDEKNIVKRIDELQPQAHAQAQPDSKAIKSKSNIKNAKAYVIAAAFSLAVILGLTARFLAKKPETLPIQAQTDNTSLATTLPPATIPEPDKMPSVAVNEPTKKPQIANVQANVQDSLDPKEVIVKPSNSSAPAISSKPNVSAADLASIVTNTTAIAQGFVQVNVTPWGKIFVDDVFVGVTPPLRRLPLTIGVHKITIRSEGFPDSVQSITIKQEQSVKVTHDFN
jgi:non-specific serine/threonine protein kinase